MTANRKIRLAYESDSKSILDIYAPFITDTAITFECEVPTIEEFMNRMSSIQEKYPWLVCEIDGIIVGYAYASQYSGRAAYDWSVDFSIYINPNYHGKKIGRALYSSLFELVKLQGYYNAYAGIALPNMKSKSFHEAFGFKMVGVYKNVGYKHGKWHDVGWYALDIAEHIKSPVKPKTINEICNTPEFEAIIQRAEKLIKD